MANAGAPQSMHEHWSSRFTFIMAAVGSAVGLGNFWRFPYVAGENGGAAFIIVYLVAVIFIALPVLMAEYAIGRRTQKSAVAAVASIAKESGHSGLWGIIGWIAMLTGFLILTFYSVIAGWVMAYVPIFFSGEMTGATSQEASAIFADLTNDPWRVLIWHSVFMGLTAIIVARGLRGGIEVAANILMPAFFIMLLGMVILALIVGDAGAAIAFLFTPDFSALKPASFVEAIGQAFFSVGVASAIMITYGAYLNRDTHIPRSAGTIAGTDTFVALIAGLAIFPLVFAIPELNPTAGPTLLFETLPTAIAQLPGAAIIGGLFFLLAFFAAMTSSISLFEVAVSWAEEHRGWSRPIMAAVLGLLAWLIGIGSVLSTSTWSDFHPFGFGPFKGETVFDSLDILTGKIMLPLSGLLLSIFAGWIISAKILQEELGLSDTVFGIWRLFMRFIIPIAIAVVLVWGNLPTPAADDGADAAEGAQEQARAFAIGDPSVC